MILVQVTGVGVHFADAAGYRASEMLNFLADLEKLENSSALRQLTATHPRPAERIATLKPLVQNRGEVLAERWTSWTANLSRSKT